MQSRIASLIESFVNILIGYTVAVLAQIIIFPLFDIHASTGDHLQIAALFTLVSLARFYAIRRVFNRLTFKKNNA